MCVGGNEGEIHVQSCYNRHQCLPIWCPAYHSCVIQLSERVGGGVHGAGQKACENDIIEICVIDDSACCTTRCIWGCITPPCLC